MPRGDVRTRLEIRVRGGSGLDAGRSRGGRIAAVAIGAPEHHGGIAVHRRLVHLAMAGPTAFARGPLGLARLRTRRDGERARRAFFRSTRVALLRDAEREDRPGPEDEGSSAQYVSTTLT